MDKKTNHKGYSYKWCCHSKNGFGEFESVHIEEQK